MFLGSLKCNSETAYTEITNIECPLDSKATKAKAKLQQIWIAAEDDSPLS